MTAPPERQAVRLPLPGIPGECQHCGAAHDEWPLMVYGNSLNITCLTCYCVVAPVRAVAAGEPCEDCGQPEDSPAHDPDNIAAHQYAPPPAEARTGGRRHGT